MGGTGTLFINGSTLLASRETTISSKWGTIQTCDQHLYQVAISVEYHKKMFLCRAQ